MNRGWMFPAQKKYLGLGQKLQMQFGNDCRMNLDSQDQLVWSLSVGALLYVGRSTMREFENRAIYTIGDIAKRDVNDLRLLLGVWGETLWHFAN